MGKDKFIEIINFAIEREKEAARFYNNLQGMVKNDSSVKMLIALEKMELKHVQILQNVTSEGIDEYITPKISDLKISDYMDEITPHSEMTFQEILITAMKREEASKKLYDNIAKESEDIKIKNLFLKLASEEARHKLQLETLYDEEVLREN